MPNIFVDIIDFIRELQPRKRYTLLAVVFLILVSIGLFFAFEKPILDALAPVAEKLRSIPYGYLILIGLIIVASFPPILGYGSLIMISGFIYGFPIGFLPAFAGALIGACLCFGTCRTLFKKHTDKLLSRDRRFAALAVAVHQEGFKIIFLIRLSPFPFTYSNAFFASIRSVSFWKFLSATVITLPKLLLHVWFGSRFSVNTSELDSTTRLINWIAVGVGIILFLVATWYIYHKTMEAARKAAGKERMIQKEDEAELGPDDADYGDASSDYFLGDEIDTVQFVEMGEHGIGSSKQHAAYKA